MITIYGFRSTTHRAQGIRCHPLRFPNHVFWHRGHPSSSFVGSKPWGHGFQAIRLHGFWIPRHDAWFPNHASSRVCGFQTITDRLQVNPHSLCATGQGQRQGQGQGQAWSPAWRKFRKGNRFACGCCFFLGWCIYSPVPRSLVYTTPWGELISVGNIVLFVREGLEF